MNPLLEQFLSEARDLLQGIGEKLMQLEAAPDDAELMTVLFRMVHTLKGNSGLFESPEMTRVLHAGEDLMDAVRQRRVAYSRELADRLLDAMDFVAMLCNEIEAGDLAVLHVADATRLVKGLRQLLPSGDEAQRPEAAVPTSLSFGAFGWEDGKPPPISELPEAVRMAVYRRALSGSIIRWVRYVPDDQCFFQGLDPLHQVRNTPGLLWRNIRARQPWPVLVELDVYRCQLDFQLLTEASSEQLEEHYRDIAEQISVLEVPPLTLVLPAGELDDEPADEHFCADATGLLAAGHLEALAAIARVSLERRQTVSWSASVLRWLLLLLEIAPDNRAALAELIESIGRGRPLMASEGLLLSAGNISDAVVGNEAARVTLTEAENAALEALLAEQRHILALPMSTGWAMGRARAAAAALAGCLRASGDLAALPGLKSATVKMDQAASAAPLLAWFDEYFSHHQPISTRESASSVDLIEADAPPRTAAAGMLRAPTRAGGDVESEPRLGRRPEDAPGRPKSLKVDQVKIDYLMNLIGEMVVSKNALPYLARRAETVFGARDLGREIKAQYAVINRIAEDLQDAIMQVSMMPVSFIFQRFPRLVRDISRKLGKEVVLVLDGDETEADKNIIESLADPLVHIIRNCLDHGFELPEVRKAAGKPAAGTLTIRASQQSDRVVIEVSDDGKGIDPEVIKRKAYEKGLIDETTLESITDQDALNLIFAAGFSTVDVVSDLSGRGVGMDVVKTAVEKVNGTLTLDSEKGRGTSIWLSLPLSMTVTNVMIVEADGQLLGVPMDSVVETVRVARSAVRTIKKSPTVVLRGRIVPLKSVNSMLGLDAPPLANAENELAVLVVRVGDESVGLLVDNFRETVDIILKPMSGVLAGLSIYSGTALMGDGSVLVILNIRELL